MIEFILSAPFVLSAIIIIAISIAILLEFEKDGWATALFSLGTALMLWAYKEEIWDVVSTNKMTTVYFVISYIIAGLVWSIIKWRSYITSKVDKYEILKSEFTRVTGEIKTSWDKWIFHLNIKLSHQFYESDTPETISTKIVPQAKDKKSLIVSWIGYWPMSLCATALNNPFRRFFEWIYSLVSGIYDKMGNKSAARIALGLEKVEAVVVDKKILKG